MERRAAKGRSVPTRGGSNLSAQLLAVPPGGGLLVYLDLLPADVLLNDLRLLHNLLALLLVRRVAF